MDPLQSFAHLTDNIPDWLLKLDQLAAQVAEQHARFARLSPSQFTEIRLAKKHDSTESLRPPKDDVDDPSSAAFTDLTESFAPPQNASVTKKQDTNIIVKEIKRKRKSGSAELSATSGQQRYRTRSLVIVYYDSAIQEAFESLVRSIAGARNNLRKGRSAATFKARMASMGVGDDGNDDNYPGLNPKLMIKRSSRTSPPVENPTFQKADEDLEAAQNLCEVAAHQFLRDGDCGEELAGTRKRFEECLETAKAEVEKLRAEEEEATADRGEPGSTTERAAEAEKRPGSKGNDVFIATEKMEAPRIPTVRIPTLPALATDGTIEVDNDSDASSVHIDLTAFRRMRRV